jgi:hypothetical protein
VASPRAHRGVASLGGHLRTALTYMVGLWPLTCVVLLMCGLLIVASNMSAP